MSKKSVSAAALLSGALALGSCNLIEVLDSGDLGGTGSTLDDKVVAGLRTALEVGIDSSSAFASQVNGYLANRAIRILLPEEAEQALAAAERMGALVKPFAEELEYVESVVSLFSASEGNALSRNLTSSNTLMRDLAGLETLSDSVVKYMNRAAEYAAPRSVPIFKSAITGMSISDGLAILNGSDSTAATAYLNGKTGPQLVNAYEPIVDSTLNLVPLTRYWGDFRSAYNAALGSYNALLAYQSSWNANAIVASTSSLRVDVLEPLEYAAIETESLGGWTTEKALSGLFYLVGEEEKEIRRNPFEYIRGLAAGISDLLGEVFGEIMEMER